MPFTIPPLEQVVALNVDARQPVLVAFTTPPFAQAAGVKEGGMQVAPFTVPPFEHDAGIGGGPTCAGEKTDTHPVLVEFTRPPFPHDAGVNAGGVQLRVARLTVPPFEHAPAVTVG